MPNDKSTNLDSNMLIGLDGGLGATSEHFGFGRDPVTNQSTGPRVLHTAASPNGVVAAPAGSVALADDGTAWQNTNGLIGGWVLLGSGGGGGAADAAIFGDGALGAVTVAVNDAAFVGGDYTTFTLNPGVTLSPPPGVNPQPIVVRATQAIVIDGTIDVSASVLVLSQVTWAFFAFSGERGSGSGGGGGGGNSGIALGVAGFDGTTNDTSGNGYTPGTSPVAGVGGLPGSPGNVGGAGVAGTPGAPLPRLLAQLSLYPGGWAPLSLGARQGQNGASGGNGGDGAAVGGAGGLGGTGGTGGGLGGSGGGLIILVAPSITISGTGSLLAAGGNGLSGSVGDPGGAAVGATADGGGGGGAGGSGAGGGGGGQILLVSTTLVNAGVTSVVGGAGGLGGAGGVGGAGDGVGTAGGAGNAGAPGCAGSTGLVVTITL